MPPVYVDRLLHLLHHLHDEQRLAMYVVYGPDQCLPCVSVDHCAANDQLTCTSANDSQCPGCDVGYCLQETGPPSRLAGAQRR